MPREYVVDGAGCRVEGADQGEQQRVELAEHLFRFVFGHRGRQAEEAVPELERARYPRQARLV